MHRLEDIERSYGCCLRFQGKEKLKMSFMEGTEQLLADKGIEDFGGER